MRVTFLGHACHLVEIDGRRVLTDPWLVDPIFEGCCEHAPELRFGPADLPPLDAIAITHAHLDHLNAPTLWQLPDKSIPVVFPHAAYTEVEDVLRRVGFDNLAPRRPFEPFALGSARVVPTPATASRPLRNPRKGAIETTLAATNSTMRPSKPPTMVISEFDLRIHCVQGRSLSASHSPAFRATDK